MQNALFQSQTQDHCKYQRSTDISHIESVLHTAKYKFDLN